MEEKDNMTGQTSPKKPNQGSTSASRRLFSLNNGTERIQKSLDANGLGSVDHNRNALEGYMRGALHWTKLRETLDEQQQLEMISSVWIKILADPKDLKKQLERGGWKPRKYRGHSFNGRDGLDFSKEEMSGEFDVLSEVSSTEFSQLFFQYARELIPDYQSPTLIDMRDLLDKIYVKSLPGRAGKKRVDKEFKRIGFYQEFNEIARQSGLTEIVLGERAEYEEFNTVPVLFTRPTEIKPRTYLAMERISRNSRRLYEKLKSIDGGKQDKKYRRKNREFWEHTIDRIVRSQVASLSLPKKYIDDVQEWDPNTREVDRNKREAVRSNREFYKNQLLRKFVGNQEGLDRTAFPGALHIALDIERDRNSKQLVRQIYSFIDEWYDPIAHILAELPPGIDCDRSLWNIFVDGNQPMVDFETVTNSPHAIALANATAQGIYFPNNKEVADHDYVFLEPGKDEPTVVIPKGSKYNFRDFLRHRYVSQFNEVLTETYNRGCLGGRFDLDAHLIKDWHRFTLGHAAAGVQRSLVHYATFLKTMRNVEQDIEDLKSLKEYCKSKFETSQYRTLSDVLDINIRGLRTEYGLANKGMIGCLTQAREHLKEVETFLGDPKYFDHKLFDFPEEDYDQYSKKLFSHQGFYRALGNLRRYNRGKYNSGKKSVVRSRLLGIDWDQIDIVTE